MSLSRGGRQQEKGCELNSRLSSVIISKTGGGSKVKLVCLCGEMSADDSHLMVIQLSTFL